eukprot:m.304469 g.304469  ORF g.304469 m.304469 type:complete len:1251 (-) comp55270_c1_seq1:55-3807(-)
MSVRVAVRVRPFNSRERELQSECVIHMRANVTELRGKGVTRDFAFDYSFWSHRPTDAHFVHQHQVYAAIGTEMLENAFQGYNTCLFAYGQTGSGKSFSMMGSDLQENRGIIPRLCEDLFARIHSLSADWTGKVEVSYMEIYLEKVRDLLSADQRKKPKVREHAITGPYVEDLTSHAVTNFEMISALMDEGNKLRTVKATKMNDVSSRSHAIFQLVFTQTQTTLDPEGNPLKLDRVSKISLVDLAGSERSGSINSGSDDRLKEGNLINKSLSTLGKVIAALADRDGSAKGKGSHIPYRDSVLTWLLRESLGGNSKTIMIAAISPASDNYEETLSTLRYAQQAKQIVNTAVVNEDSTATLVRQLNNEIETLRAQLAQALVTAPADRRASEEEQLQQSALEAQLQISEKLRESLSVSWEEKLEETLRIQTERQSQLRAHGIILVEGDEAASPLGVMAPTGVPFLINLKPNLRQSSCLLYYLTEGVTKVVARNFEETGDASAPSSATIAASRAIELGGRSILPDHCSFVSKRMTEGDGLTTSIIPNEGAILYVNRRAVTEEQHLRTGDCISFGNQLEFRFTNPLEAWTDHDDEDISVGSQPFDSLGADEEGTEGEKRRHLQESLVQQQKQQQQQIQEHQQQLALQLEQQQHQFSLQEEELQERKDALERMQHELELQAQERDRYQQEQELLLERQRLLEQQRLEEQFHLQSEQFRLQEQQRLLEAQQSELLREQDRLAQLKKQQEAQAEALAAMTIVAAVPPPPPQRTTAVSNLLETIDSSTPRTSSSSNLAERLRKLTAPTISRRYNLPGSSTEEVAELRDESAFSYEKQDEGRLLSSLITNADGSKVSFKLTPAYGLNCMLLFCESHLSAKELRDFLLDVGTLIKMKLYECITEKDVASISFWLANSSELLTAIKSDEHLLTTSGEIQVLLANCAEDAFSALVDQIKARIQPAIPALLREHSSGQATSAPSPLRPRPSGLALLESAADVDFLIATLEAVLTLLRVCEVSRFIMEQVFAFVFHHIGGSLFNKFMGSTEYFHWERGLIIKFNLTKLQDWASLSGLQHVFDVHFVFISEAALLLQTNKSQLSHLDHICEICSHLNSLQLDHILKNYRASRDEGPVNVTLVDCLKARAANSVDLACLDDESCNFKVQLLRNADMLAPFHLVGRYHMQTGLGDRHLLSTIKDYLLHILSGAEVVLSAPPSPKVSHRHEGGSKVVAAASKWARLADFQSPIATPRSTTPSPQPAQAPK